MIVEQMPAAAATLGEWNGFVCLSERSVSLRGGVLPVERFHWSLKAKLCCVLFSFLLRVAELCEFSTYTRIPSTCNDWQRTKMAMNLFVLDILSLSLCPCFSDTRDQRLLRLELIRIESFLSSREFSSIPACRWQRNKKVFRSRCSPSATRTYSICAVHGCAGNESTRSSVQRTRSETWHRPI